MSNQTCLGMPYGISNGQVMFDLEKLGQGQMMTLMTKMALFKKYWTLSLGAKQLGNDMAVPVVIRSRSIDDLDEKHGS